MHIFFCLRFLVATFVATVSLALSLSLFGMPWALENLGVSFAFSAAVLFASSSVTFVSCCFPVHCLLPLSAMAGSKTHLLPTNQTECVRTRSKKVVCADHFLSCMHPSPGACKTATTKIRLQSPALKQCVKTLSM